MNSTTITRAESIIREALDGKTTWRVRAELFLARQPGRPRKVSREECRRLKSEGWTASEIAAWLGCHTSNVFRALK